VSAGARSDGSLRFGVFIPQGWKLEYTGWGAADAWARSVEFAQQGEQLGYDHLWVYDHVETVPRREPTHMFEAYTMLSAISQQTSTVGLGQLVTCCSYRNAGLLAKEAACLDVYSGGRAILGLGAGWYHQEYASYGYRYPPDLERLAVLDETLQVVAKCWTEERVTFDGQHIQMADAYAEPKPLQDLPPVWVGGGGEKVTLRIAARHADATNWQVGLDGFIHKSGLLEKYCAEIDRDFATITRTHGPDCMIFETEAECRAWCETPDGGNLWGGQDTETYLRDNLVGTVEQVAEKAQGFVDAGCREFVLWLRDAPGDVTLRRFIAEVVPRLSA
jgi:F420-dependent oxidoreductase-like protein